MLVGLLCMYVLVGGTALCVCICWRDRSVCMYLLEGLLCMNVFVGGTALCTNRATKASTTTGGGWLLYKLTNKFHINQNIGINYFKQCMKCR